MEYPIENITTMGCLTIQAIKVGKIYLAFKGLSQEVIQTDYMTSLLIALVERKVQLRITRKKTLFTHVRLPFTVKGRNEIAEVYVSRNYAGLVYALLTSIPAEQPA